MRAVSLALLAAVPALAAPGRPAPARAEGPDRPCQSVDPAWSPDGRWIYFASDCRNGELDLYRMPSGGGEPERLTTTPGDEHAPAFSNDGSRIAFAYQPKGEPPDLWIAATDLTGRRRVTRDGYTDWDPTWSADGGRLAFEQTRDGKVDIWIVDVESGEETSLTRNPDRDVGPAWSPDGSVIAYQSKREGHYRIYAASPAGGDERALVALDGDDVAPCWFPDSRRIAFVHSDGKHGEIWTAGADGADPRRLTGDPELFEFLPAVSPDGRSVAFIARPTDGSGTWDIEVVGTDGSNRRRLTRTGGWTDRPSRPPTPGLYWPEASPDGQHLLYESPARGGPIHIVGADGAHDRVLAPGTRAAWFPDGERILAVVKRGSEDGLVVLRLDGSRADTLPYTHARPLWRPRISPDGARIVLGEIEPPSHPNVFHVIRLDGTRVREIRPAAPGEVEEPTWSHDGRLAFVAMRRDSAGVVRSTDLYTMNADGTGERKITTLPGGAQWITWSPDDRRIALQDDRGKHGDIVVVEVAGGAMRRIAPHARPYLDETPSWSSDGHIYFQSDRGGTYAIYGMAPDGSGQRCVLGCSNRAQ